VEEQVVVEIILKVVAEVEQEDIVLHFQEELQ
jgi:hypothetical protein